MPVLEDLLDKLEAGFYIVPEIQRGFVWKNPQVRDLINSIYHNEPIGGIVFWELHPQILKDDDFRGLFRPLADNLPIENGKYLVIDGQQRLTSLLLVKKGELFIGGKKKGIKLYFNPIDETFELYSRKIENVPEWFNVTEIVNSDDVYRIIENQAEKFGEQSIRSNPKVRKNLNRLQNTFKTYEVYLIPAKLSYTGDFLSTLEQIAKIFVTINSTGTRIRMPDLALALLTTKTRKDIGLSFRNKFELLLEKTKNMGLLVDETVLIRAYCAIATGTTKFNDAKRELVKMTGEKIINLLEEMEKSVEATIKLMQELGIKSEKYLQSRYLLVPLIYLLYKEILSTGYMISDAMKENIARYLILASHEKRYTGKLETDLFNDIAQLKDGKGVTGLLENLRIKEIPLSTFEEEYETYHLTMLLLLYNKNKAFDWDLKEMPYPKRISELEAKRLSIHHIFPQEFLERRGLSEGWDVVGNITIVSDDANNFLKFKDPKQYLVDLYNKNPELLEKHFIPLDQTLWHIDNYELFLKERAKLIAKAIEKEFNIRIHFDVSSESQRSF